MSSTTYRVLPAGSGTGNFETQMEQLLRARRASSLVNARLAPIRLSGFTLIEAMIVVGILAIVVALAYPSYIDQVRKTRRADAEAALLARAQLLERCFTRLNAYDHGDCPDPEGLSDDGYYDVTAVRTATTYTLTAEPQGDQATDPCGNYTLDHLGNKTPGPGSNRCWGSS